MPSVAEINGFAFAVGDVLLSEYMFARRRLESAVPPDDDAFAATWAYVKVVAPDVMIVKVPLKDESVTPAMVTVSPAMKLEPDGIVTVTIFDARVMEDMLTAGGSLMYTVTVAAGNDPVTLRVITPLDPVIARVVLPASLKPWSFCIYLS